MRRDVGKLGELAFGLFCEQAGLLAHPPGQDRLGWDFLVEAPSDSNAHSALLDKTPPPVEFRVQAKSTDRATRRVSISLSQMHRLATLQMPVFFCVLVFHGKPVPERVFLIHLGEELIARTLARVRRLGPEHSNELHRRSLSIPYDECHEIASPFHEALRAQITNHVPDGMDKYIAWKNAIIASTGYFDPRIVMDLTFEGVKTSEFVDFFLGLKKDLNVRSMSAVERRFGISRPIEPHGKGPAVLSITGHPKRPDAVISFRKDRFSPGYDFPATCYCPPPALNLPEDEVRLRFVAQTCEFVLWPHTNKIQFLNVPSSKTEHPLKDLAQFANVMHLISDTTTTACLMEISLSGKAVFCCTIKMKSAPVNWEAYARVAAVAEDLATRAGAADRARASLEQLMGCQAALQNIHELIVGAPARVTFDNPDLYHPNNNSGFLKVFCVPVGNMRIGGVFAIVGKPIVDGEMYRVDCRNARLIRLFAKPVEEEWTKDLESELLRLGSDALTADNIIPIMA